MFIQLSLTRQDFSSPPDEIGAIAHYCSRRALEAVRLELSKIRKEHHGETNLVLRFRDDWQQGRHVDGHLASTEELCRYKVSPEQVLHKNEPNPYPWYHMRHEARQQPVQMTHDFIKIVLPSFSHSLRCHCYNLNGQSAILQASCCVLMFWDKSLISVLARGDLMVALQG